MLSTPAKVFALVDCNSFYVFCERVFNPCVSNKPVVVLSNNDGCVISRSHEAKELSIAMGAPIFKCEELVRTHNVKIFSSNFVLYGDMFNRVMSVLSEFTPSLEVYSIDEVFLALEQFQNLNLFEYAKKIRASVAHTKTLAKVANHYAKDHDQTAGVFCLMGKEKIDQILKETSIGEIWGIGREKAIFLERHGIKRIGGS